MTIESVVGRVGCVVEKETMRGRGRQTEKNRDRSSRKGVDRQQRRKKAQKQATCGCVKNLGNDGCGRRSRRTDERGLWDDESERKRPERGHLR